MNVELGDDGESVNLSDITADDLPLAAQVFMVQHPELEPSEALDLCFQAGIAILANGGALAIDGDSQHVHGDVPCPLAEVMLDQLRYGKGNRDALAAALGHPGAFTEHSGPDDG